MANVSERLVKVRVSLECARGQLVVQENPTRANSIDAQSQLGIAKGLFGTGSMNNNKGRSTRKARQVMFLAMSDCGPRPAALDPKGLLQVEPRHRSAVFEETESRHWWGGNNGIPS